MWHRCNSVGYVRTFKGDTVWHCGGDYRMASRQQYRAHDYIG